MVNETNRRKMSVLMGPGVLSGVSDDGGGDGDV
jgi:hypothetical protein